MKGWVKKPNYWKWACDVKIDNAFLNTFQRCCALYKRWTSHCHIERRSPAPDFLRISNFKATLSFILASKLNFKDDQTFLSYPLLFLLFPRDSEFQDFQTPYRDWLLNPLMTSQHHFRLCHKTFANPVSLQETWLSSPQPQTVRQHSASVPLSPPPPPHPYSLQS